MSFVVRTYACEECEHRFELFQEREAGPPRFCPACGAEFDPEAEAVPGTKNIGGSAIARSTDMTYRQLEESSAARAAELDAPSLKVTNLNDNLREGDVAAKGPPQNTIWHFDQSLSSDPQYGRKMTGWGGGFGGPIGTATRGNAPGPGHVALSGVQPEHQARVQQSMASTPYQPFRGEARATAKLPTSPAPRRPRPRAKQ